MKKVKFLVALLAIITLVACSSKTIEVTRIVEVTPISALQKVIEVTRLIENDVTKIIEVPVEVTRVVENQVIVEMPVEVTRVVEISEIEVTRLVEVEVTRVVFVEVPVSDEPPDIPSALNSTWHVSKSGSDTYGNGSATNPFATIQYGINNANDGDTVLVYPGTYTENINFKGKNITVSSLFAIDEDKNYISQTVINGGRNGRVVTFENGEDSTAVLSGFTITNGYVSGDEIDSHGGGIACIESSPSLMHLEVADNEAVGEGGGLYFVHSSSSLRDTNVFNNVSSGGGGIRYSYGSPQIENVIVSANLSRMSGGGIFFYHADASVKNVLIVNNVAEDAWGGDGGGGLYFDGCNPQFVNVTIVGNSTSGGGGGLHVSFASHPNLTNTIIWDNSPDQIYFDTDWGGEAVTINYSNIQSGCDGIVTNGQRPVYCGVGVIDFDPLFIVDDDDYHLSNFSPVIGAGTISGAPLFDIEGNPRPSPANSNPDMGAYENILGVPESTP